LHYRLALLGRDTQGRRYALGYLPGRPPLPALDLDYGDGGAARLVCQVIPGHAQRLATLF
jgi:hypothetical protein